MSQTVWGNTQIPGNPSAAFSHRAFTNMLPTSFQRVLDLSANINIRTLQKSIADPSPTDPDWSSITHNHMILIFIRQNRHLSKHYQTANSNFAFTYLTFVLNYTNKAHRWYYKVWLVLQSKNINLYFFTELMIIKILHMLMCTCFIQTVDYNSFVSVKWHPLQASK